MLSLMTKFEEDPLEQRFENNVLSGVHSTAYIMVIDCHETAFLWVCVIELNSAGISSLLVAQRLAYISFAR